MKPIFSAFKGDLVDNHLTIFRLLKGKKLKLKYVFCCYSLFILVVYKPDRIMYIYAP